MQAKATPHWWGVPVRVLLITFLVTLLSFALSLLLGILGTVSLAALRGVAPNFSIAYRHVAVPVAALVCLVALITSVVVETRQYRQAKTLAQIARSSGRAA
jgi:hypothetical protein